MPPRLRAIPLLLLTASLPAAALQAGDLMFTAFNADRDGWTVVALVELAPHTTVYFSDNRWDSAAGLFVGSESHHRWDSGPKPLTAGTVVQFDRIDHAQLLSASGGTLARERVAGSSTYGLSQSGETVYAYQGSSAAAPTQFLTALSTAGFSASTGSLIGTGLTSGMNALALSVGSDYADYVGPRAGLTAPQFAATMSQPGNWKDLGDLNSLAAAAQAPSLSAFSVTPVPEPGPLSLAAVGAAVLAGWHRRRRWMALRHAGNAHLGNANPAKSGRTDGPVHTGHAQRRLIQPGLLLAMLVGATHPSQAASQVTQVVELGTLAAPITMFLGDAFNDLDPNSPGLQLIRGGSALSLSPGDTFIDQYRFSVAAVEFSAIASTIDLTVVFNVNALQVHLYGGDALQLSSIGAPQGITGIVPTASASGSGELQTLQPLPLAAGTYVMEVRGQVDGLSGGSYAGVINLSPVPETSGWALALAGLAVLAAKRRLGTSGPSTNTHSKKGPFGPLT